MPVHGIVVVPAEVPAVDVVHEAVLVIVLAVAGNLSGVGPDVALQVGVPVVDAGVDDCNRHRVRALGNVPGRGCIDLRQGPLPAEIGVVRHFGSPQDVVGFRIGDRGILLQLFRQLPQAHLALVAYQGDGQFGQCGSSRSGNLGLGEFPLHHDVCP